METTEIAIIVSSVKPHVALGTAFFLTDRVAFADVVENVKKAKAVNFTCKQKVTPNSPMLEQKWFIQGDFMRLEMPGIQEGFRAEEPVILAVIADFKEKKGLQIDYPTKTAKRLKFDEFAFQNYGFDFHK